MLPLYVLLLQCTVNALASLAKLQCSTPALVAALIAPLQRCLSSQSDPLAPFALSNLVWALAKNFSAFKPAFLAVKGWLLVQIWQYCAAFDPQVRQPRSELSGHGALTVCH